MSEVNRKIKKCDNEKKIRFNNNSYLTSSPVTSGDEREESITFSRHNKSQRFFDSNNSISLAISQINELVPSLLTSYPEDAEKFLTTLDDLRKYLKENPDALRVNSQWFESVITYLQKLGDSFLYSTNAKVPMATTYLKSKTIELKLLYAVAHPFSEKSDSLTSSISSQEVEEREISSQSEDFSDNEKEQGAVDLYIS
jgi:hypothetical protein